VDRRLVAVVASILIPLSCTRPSSTPTPIPGSASANNEPAVVPPRRVPPSRDSTAKLRAVYVAQVMQRIAGHESEPAEQVFKNVQVLKGLTAAQLVHKMDADYGTAMSWNCTNCHRFAPQGDFASDTANNKRRARFMQQMVNDINTNQLPKLYPRDTPQVDCATCHRGYNEPPEPQYLIPERGKPGGLPPLPPRPGTPGVTRAPGAER
jgi:hypothetical protein